MTSGTFAGSTPVLAAMAAVMAASSACAPRTARVVKPPAESGATLYLNVDMGLAGMGGCGGAGLGDRWKGFFFFAGFTGAGGAASHTADGASHTAEGWSQAVGVLEVRGGIGRQPLTADRAKPRLIAFVTASFQRAENKL